MKKMEHNIVQVLTTLVSIECTKEGVKFSCQGDIGSGSVQLRQHTNVEKASENVSIDLSEPVSLTFSLKYLVNFCKASGLSDSVKLSLSSEVPLLVEYTLSENSYLRFYLAPKVRLLHIVARYSCANVYRLATRSNRFVVMSDAFLRFMWEYRRRTVYIYGLHTEHYQVHVLRVRVDERATHPCPQRAPRLCPTIDRPTSSRVEFQIRKYNTLTHPTHCHCICFCVFSELLSTLNLITMATDALLPETRVLAIASHVRVTRHLQRVSNERDR